ncbi:MAG: alpha-mannosidase [Clostridia bacterium]|nr:alpha-mannosidase [Clostridia bacterium]
MKKLYLIGNSHIDPVWLWHWQDGYSEVLATFRSALDRMKETADFKYTGACAVYYQWVEKTDPEMFEEIKARVKEGRWNIVGGWFLQPDCNMPSGESFARHSLISQRYFKEKFGITAKSGYNVDSFGHNASLPKILRAGGMENYVYMRPDKNEKAQDFDLFTWKSDDGSVVTAYRIPESYGISLDILYKLDRIVASVESDGKPRMAFYGVGNHGGGPTAELIDKIKSKNIPHSGFATVDEYFSEVEKDGLPIVSEELQHHARGCYSATSYVKTMNRRCEENLLVAERFCLLASRLVGFKYPKKALKKAWKNLLFNQFHDILAGCSIESAYVDASYLFGEIMSITEQAINGALQSICRKIDTGASSETGVKSSKHCLVWEHETLGTPLVVFNPHAFPVKDTITMRISASRMTDEQGNEIPFQLTRGEQTNDGDKHVVTFPVEIPAYGYRVYRAFSVAKAVKEFPSVYAENNVLENDLLRVEFDTESGEISRIYDKKSGRIIANGGFKTILTDETDCDTWAHKKFDLGEECGRFGHPEFKVIEKGSVCATVRIKTSFGNSTLVRHYTLNMGSDELRVWGEVDFRECHRVLKLSFPAKNNVRCEIPYGVIERPLKNGEEPFGKWFASNGLCVANTGKHGYDSTDSEIRMTVLRGAIYADHYGFNERDDRCRFMDRGPQNFTYSLFAYTTDADAHRKAAVLHSPLRAVNETFHRGTLPERFEGFSGDLDGVIVTAIKQAEDGVGAIMRWIETEGTGKTVTFKFLGSEVKADVTPYAITTINENGERLNFMEWKLTE